MPPMEPIVVLITAPDAKTARKVATPLVEEGLAACVNVVPGLRSIYRWEGKTCDEAEVLLVVKTQRACFEALAARVRELHPYSVPEVIALPVVEGSAAYLDWVAASTRQAARGRSGATPTRKSRSRRKARR